MNDDELRHYSRALDEIYFLRQMLAYEARVVEATLDYKTFPKSRRAIHEAQVQRMRNATHESAIHAAIGYPSLSLRSCMREAGMPETLTRGQWEEQA